jgi:hypothetical protein
MKIPSFKMLGFTIKLGKNFALDLTGPRLIRNFSDGITFCNFYIDLDLYKEDHKPSFEINFTFINIMIFQFEIYNVFHHG